MHLARASPIFVSNFTKNVNKQREPTSTTRVTKVDHLISKIHTTHVIMVERPISMIHITNVAKVERWMPTIHWRTLKSTPQMISTTART